MLDEPMAGVNPALKQVLNAHIQTLRDDGMTVLFVEHDMDMVHDISDWVVVMAEGRVISEGTPDQISSDPAVIDAYLGTAPGSVDARRRARGGRGVRRCRMRQRPPRSFPGTASARSSRPAASSPATCPVSTSSTGST